jgi:8-oxo-dGTP pyrophosphatase MutT (NUDIX family)
MPAAVLVPLLERDEGLTVLLTRRTDHLPDHPGQISFPGGRVESRDVSVMETALRETEEEIGLGRAYVEVVGLLDCYDTVTGYRITPVVGFVSSGYSLHPDPAEVAEVLEVPFAFLLDPGNRQVRHVTVGGKRRTFYAFDYGPHFIWGATAGMLVGFLRRLES